ncbi:Asp-tRNA(Asn)/Glu-tRNA(Gln) amidotransferase subunit GatC [Candidatus Margulisiibacteriota bacterium]
MDIKKEDIEKLAHLSRLALTEDEITMYTEQLGDIVNYAQSINELDLKDVPPMTHPMVPENVWREDELKECNLKEGLLKNAPERDDGFFVVPRMIDES